MSVIVSVEDKGVGQKEVKIAIPAPAVEAEARRVAQDYRKKVRLPGFRKGKVPTELLTQRFGDDIERDVVERLVPRYWRQAEAEAQLDPMLPPALGDVDHPPGEDLTFVAIVDLAPEITLRNVTDFDLPDPAVEPTDEEVDQALEEVRRGLADWVEVERPVARGDRVKVTIREEPTIVLTDASPDDEPEGQPLVFEVGEPQVWEELGLAVTGKRTGQTAEFERSPAEGEAAKSYRVTIEEVHERELPPLDDEFAQRVGELETVAALREDVTSRLAAGKRAERRRQRESALVEQLIERHPIQLSERVIHHEVEQVLGEYASDLSRQGVDVEGAGLDWQKMGQQVQPQAERRVKARLILDRVAEAQDVQASDEDLEAALAALARRERTSSQALRRALDRDGRLAALKRQLVRDKTIGQLLGEDGAGDADGAGDGAEPDPTTK